MEQRLVASWMADGAATAFSLDSRDGPLAVLVNGVACITSAAPGAGFAVSVANGATTVSFEAVPPLGATVALAMSTGLMHPAGTPVVYGTRRLASP